MSTIVSISGSVAVGKSTLVELLGTKVAGAVVAPEYVGTMHYLPLFYADPRGFALQSRLEFLAVKARQLNAIDRSARVSILDRSLPELITFARALNENGLMPDAEFALYTDLYEVLTDALPAIDLFVLVKASPARMLERIQTRAREFEKGITREYLERIDLEYASWFDTLPTGSKVIVDTTSQDAEATAGHVADWIERHLE